MVESLRKLRVEAGLFAVGLALSISGVAIVLQPGEGTAGVVGWIFTAAGLFFLLIAALLWEPLSSALPKIKRLPDRPGHLTLTFIAPERKRKRKRKLKERAMAASSAILTLLAEFERTNPLRGPMWSELPGYNKLSDEEKHEASAAFMKKGHDHWLVYLHRYDGKWAAEALDLFDLFQERGLVDDPNLTTLRERFEWPVNTFGLREVGHSLGRWARKL